MQSTIKTPDKTYQLICNFGVIKAVWQHFNLPHFNAVLERIELMFPDIDKAKKNGETDTKNPLNWSSDDWDFMAYLLSAMINEGAVKHKSDSISPAECEEVFFPFYHHWLTHLGTCFFGFLGTMRGAVNQEEIEESEEDKKKVKTMHPE